MSLGFDNHEFATHNNYLKSALAIAVAATVVVLVPVQALIPFITFPDHDYFCYYYYHHYVIISITD